MGKNKGWKPLMMGSAHAAKCLDCGFAVSVEAESNVSARYSLQEMIYHDTACVPGNDKPPTNPIGLALGMSIQLRDLFVLAQVARHRRCVILNNEARMMYANADTLLEVRNEISRSEKTM